MRCNRNPAPHRATSIRRQHGFAAISILTFIVIASLYSLTSQLKVAATTNPHAREARSIETLARAKSALIAFAAENPNRPGGLPCPDRDGDGEAELTCDRPEWRVGFFPWQTLRTGDLRDASGSRLWYALSANFRNDPDIAINSLVQGELTVQRKDPSGAITIETEDAVALVIAPGVPLPNQKRTGPTDPRVDAWLEGENAGGVGTVFTTSRGNAQINDALVALSAAELFDVVDRVVAGRIRAEIAPLIRERVFNGWQSLPFAVPFESPLESSYEDTDRANPMRGLLPASNRAGWVHWDLTNIEIEELPSAGAVVSKKCSASVATEIRCDITYDGSVKIRIGAIAKNVGRAFVAPLAATDEDYGPSSLVGRAVVNHPIDASGDARIEATAILPALSTRIRITLHAPRPIRELTDENVPVATPHSWYARNRWHELTYYALSENVRPGAGAKTCVAAEVPTCLTVEDRRGHRVDAASVLVFMGRPREGVVKSNPDALSSYLEGDNALALSKTFVDATPSSAFNDSVIVLCTNPAAGCKS